MSEQLTLLWYRFKYLLLGALLVVPAIAGVLLRDQGEQESAVSNRAGGEIVRLQQGGQALEQCLETHEMYGEARLDCLAQLATAAPLVIGPRGVLLPGPVWLMGTEQLPLTGIPGTVVTAAVADLDNDGFEEIAVSTVENGLRIYNTGADGKLVDTTSSRIAAPATTRTDGQPSTELAPRDLLAVDVDGDGWTDLLTANAVQVRLYLNLGWAGPGILKGGVDRRYDIPLDKYFPRGTAVNNISALRGADIDSDGATDILFANPQGLLLILWGGSDGFAAEPSLLPVPAGTVDVEIGDLNRDGRSDLVLGVNVRGLPDGVRGICPYSRPCDRGRGVKTGGTVVLLGGADRALTEDPALTIDGVADLNAIELIDTDMDGWQELAIGVEPLDGDVSSLRQNGVRLYDPVAGTGQLTGYELWETAAVSATGAVSALSATDIDEDGDEDLLISGRGPEGIRFWRNDLPQKHWLRVSVSGRAGLDTPGTVRNGIGALVEVTYQGRTWRREIGANSGKGESQQYVAVIGLGDGPDVAEKVTVYFPTSRERVELLNVELNQSLAVAEPAN